MARLLGGLGAAGVRLVASRTGGWPLAIAALLAAGAAATSPRARSWAGLARDPLRTALSVTAEVGAFYLEAERNFAKLALPLADDLNELDPNSADAREAARQNAFDKAAANWAARQMAGANEETSKYTRPQPMH